MTRPQQWIIVDQIFYSVIPCHPHCWSKAFVAAAVVNCQPVPNWDDHLTVLGLCWCQSGSVLNLERWCEAGWTHQPCNHSHIIYIYMIIYDLYIYTYSTYIHTHIYIYTHRIYSIYIYICISISYSHNIAMTWDPPCATAAGSTVKIRGSFFGWRLVASVTSRRAVDLINENREDHGDLTMKTWGFHQPTCFFWFDHQDFHQEASNIRFLDLYW